MVVFEDDSGCAFEDDRSVFIQATYFCHSGELFVIPAKAGIQEVFVLQTIKRKRIWIPNQVGDDSGVVFGDDSGGAFGDDNYF